MATNRLALLALFVFPLAAADQRITPSPAGPYHVSGHEILDSKGRAFLLRGTQLPPFSLKTAAKNSASGVTFGSYSGTSLAAIRLRFNMNAVRIPIDAAEAIHPDSLNELVSLVGRVNQYELLAVLAPAEPSDALAAQFKDYPNVLIEDGTLKAALVTWDLNFLDMAACAAIPSDPADAAAMVESKLKHFDEQGISYFVSTFEPGNLVKDLAYHDATSLENGWTCGQQAYPQPGLGRVVQAHLKGTHERGLFVVSAAGGLDVPRGGYAIAYGPVMASRDFQVHTARLPFTTGDLQVEVTDARGVSRSAPIFWASAGWGQINFVIPEASAPGPAMMTIVRTDGSRESAKIQIADTVPGFYARVSCRGPATGSVIQVTAAGRKSTHRLAACQGANCSLFPVAPDAAAKTVLRLEASGVRHARSASDIEVTIGGVRVPVLSYGASTEEGMDQITVEVPRSLEGLGETDIVARLNGRISNPVRVRIGSTT